MNIGFIKRKTHYFPRFYTRLFAHDTRRKVILLSAGKLTAESKQYNLNARITAKYVAKSVICEAVGIKTELSYSVTNKYSSW